MLETVRAYAVERLEASPDAETIRERHHRHFLAYAQRHGDRRALARAGSSTHLACIDARVDRPSTRPSRR